MDSFGPARLFLFARFAGVRKTVCHCSSTSLACSRQFTRCGFFWTCSAVPVRQPRWRAEDSLSLLVSFAGEQQTVYEMWIPLDLLGCACSPASLACRLGIASAAQTSECHLGISSLPARSVCLQVGSLSTLDCRVGVAEATHTECHFGISSLLVQIRLPAVW